MFAAGNIFRLPYESELSTAYAQMCTRLRVQSTRASSTPKSILPHKKEHRISAVFVWWNRPVTAHYHGKDYMDIVGKIDVAPVMARKFIEGYKTPPKPVLSLSNSRF